MARHMQLVIVTGHLATSAYKWTLVLWQTKYTLQACNLPGSDPEDELSEVREELHHALCDVSQQPKW